MSSQDRTFPQAASFAVGQGLEKPTTTGRGAVDVRARCEIVEGTRKKSQIIVSQIPYQQTRDNVVEKIAGLVKSDKVKGITGIKDVSDLKEPVKLLIDVKSDADPEVVLNQLYQFSPLQTRISLIFLALVDGKPRELNLKEMLLEFIRHRVSVIRRRTQFLLARARRRKHTIEGLLLALADIDQIIKIIRGSSTQAEAKTGLMGVECPASMMQRALGDAGFENFQSERGVADTYRLTAVQADAILKMTLGQLVNLEQERLGGEYNSLLEEITEYLRILGDEKIILGMIKDDLDEIQKKYADARRTEITGEELGNVDLADLITEENMVVSISHRGYIKRTPVSTYKAQKRGGKGLKGAKTEDEDPIEHVFAASTHDYLLFFTNKGRVHWQKVYDLPELSRESRGRAIVNLLQLEKDEKIADCRSVRDFTLPDHYLMMATKNGLVKKTPLSAYGRPKRGGIIAIKLRDDDELIDVVVCKDGDEVVLSTAAGMAIRFNQEDARPMGRNTSGVKGISLRQGDILVGMVVVEPDSTLLTTCEHGYGKRTYFGTSTTNDESQEDDGSSTMRYRTQNRGGKGVRDIKTTDRNGKAIGIVVVDDDDEILLMTARGKIQRIQCRDIKPIGRNTQGVRIMNVDKGDTLAAVVRVPPDDNGDDENDDSGSPVDIENVADNEAPSNDQQANDQDENDQNDLEQADGDDQE